MNKYLVILLSLLFPCVLLAQNKEIRAIDNKGTIIYVDPSKWYQVGSNLFNKNTNGNVAIGIDPSSIKPVDSRLYISNENSPSVPVLKLDTPFAGALTDSVLTWNPVDFSIRKIAISKLSPNDWHLLGNNGTDPATNFLGTTDNQPLMFRVNNTNSGMIGLEPGNSNTALGYQTLTNWTGVSPNNGQENTAIGTNALALGGASLDNTAIGANTLSKLNSSSFSGNTAVGSSALSNANGTDPTSGQNTAVGFLSLTNTTTGSYNTALGASALNSNSIGSYNTALGNLALQNSTGNYNVAVGNTAGNLAGMTGNSNILIGGGGSAVGATVNTSSLGVNNELNIGNTLFGTGVNGVAGGTGGKIGINTNAPIAALDVRGSVRTGTPPSTLPAPGIGTNSFAGGTGSSATTANSFAYGDGAKAEGTGAIAFGKSSAGAILSFAAGNGNTINKGANYSVLLGQSNTAYSNETSGNGYAAFAAGYLNSIYAQNSAALGSENIVNNTLGTSKSSVALGFKNTTDGTAAIAMGSENTTKGSSNVAMGVKNTVELGTAAVAMGTTNTNRSNYSVAMGANNILNAFADWSVAMGSTNSIGNGTDPSYYSLAVGKSNTINGTTSVAIGQNNTINTKNGTIIGSYATVSNEGSIVLADISSSTNVVTSTNNEFIGMFNGGYRLLTNRANLTRGMTMDNLGNAIFSGNVSSPSFVITSDMRLKKDIQDLTGVLNNIKQLRGVNYYWKDSSKGTDRQLGMIAQELEKVYPELVYTNKETGMKAVNYPQFTAVLLEGIKEQQTQIEDLKSEVEILKKQVQEIKDLLKK